MASPGKPAMGWLDGSDDSWQRLSDFLAKEGENEIGAFRLPRRANSVRVVVIRHGMAHHNTYGGIGSLVSEDAHLNECGRAQADRVGDLLCANGVLDELDLVVVSPFRRTLQTASRLLGVYAGEEREVAEDREYRARAFGYEVEPCVGCRQRPLPIVLQPLCAERTDLLSHVGRGNRGSTVDELIAENPEFGRIFNFAPLQRYCARQRIGSKTSERRGKWWHHWAHAHEKDGSFHRRCGALRRWLGALAGRKTVLDASTPSTRCFHVTDGVPEPSVDVPNTQGSDDDDEVVFQALQGNAKEFDLEEPIRTVLLVTHGGLMEEAFGFRPNAPNCGFRVLDVDASGACVRVLNGQTVFGPTRKPAFEVHGVHRRVEPKDCSVLFEIELEICSQGFTHHVLEAELRESIHAEVRENLDRRDYEGYGLSSKFPGRRLTDKTSDPAMDIQDYLEQLAIAVADPDFPPNVRAHISRQLLGGLLPREQLQSIEEFIGTSSSKLFQPAPSPQDVSGGCVVDVEDVGKT